MSKVEFVKGYLVIYMLADWFSPKISWIGNLLNANVLCPNQISPHLLELTWRISLTLIFYKL